eukprot:1799976-Amphidinium_carterae.1
MAVYVHGDDFVVAAPRECVHMFVEGLGRHLIVKNRGVMGPRTDDTKELCILNRCLRWVDGPQGPRLEYEADPRHVELVHKQLCLEGRGAKGVTTPGVRRKLEEMEGAQPLSVSQASLFRSICMRLAYLAWDRPDLQYSVKECTRHMSSPTSVSWEMVKRIG